MKDIKEMNIANAGLSLLLIILLLVLASFDGSDFCRQAQERTIESYLNEEDIESISLTHSHCGDTIWIGKVIITGSNEAKSCKRVIITPNTMSSHQIHCEQKNLPQGY